MQNVETEDRIISYGDFLKIHMAVGTVIAVEDNLKAIKPAFVLTIDFGPYGLKKSSAQLTENYQKEELLHKQVVAVINFETKRIAGVKSEVLVLGACSDERGVILMHPSMTVPNGSRLL